MKAKVNGAEVEGTPEEIAQILGVKYYMGLNPTIKDNALDNLFLDAWNQRKFNGD